MRPESSTKNDTIDMLLDKSWENPPAHLTRQLMTIPTQVALIQRREADRFSNFLNAILVLWASGLIIYFWTPLEKMISYFSTQILGLSIASPDIFTHPILGLIMIAAIILTWVWMDIEEHPRSI